MSNLIVVEGPFAIISYDRDTGKFTAVEWRRGFRKYILRVNGEDVTWSRSKAEIIKRARYIAHSTQTRVDAD